MAQSTLVGDLIQDGKELIDDLVRANVPVAAAWWARVIPETTFMGDRPDWQFFLASSLVEQQGPGVAYQKAFDALRTSPRGDAILARITVSMIKIVGETDPIAADVFKIVRAYGGKPPIYVARCRLGQIEVEEVHIFYVTTLPAPWQSLVLKTAVEAEEPLSQQESQAMNQIVASGINPIQAGYWLFKERAAIPHRSIIPAGTTVNARMIGAENDPEPLLQFTLPDGRHG